ncbi:hypothetical protein AYK20_08920 [Thermoplasmatales archaeon SG8-52-1]|nr:MAG: hypothetical protein AYK20_08920 [Thermoplasmatales archaeon SG8-52-1]
MVAKTRSAMVIAFLAGILLLISGISGLATWETIKNFVTQNIIDNTIVQLIFAFLIFIASLGGLSVIAGGLLIGKNKIRTGKFLILLGAGMGLVGLIFTVAVAYAEGSLTLGSFFSIGTIGLVLSIIARLIVKK